MNSKWGTYPWVIEHGADLIHPADLEAFKQEANSSKVFECIEGSDYITLKYNNNCYRVRHKLFKLVPAPQYYFGEIVKIKKNEEEAIITDIMWHYGKQEHYYLISIRDKKSQRDTWNQNLCEA